MALLTFAEQVRTDGWGDCDLGYWKRFAAERCEQGDYHYDEMSQIMTALSLIADLASRVPEWDKVYAATQEELSRQHRNSAEALREATGEEPPVPSEVPWHRPFGPGGRDGRSQPGREAEPGHRPLSDDGPVG